MTDKPIASSIGFEEELLKALNLQQAGEFVKAQQIYAYLLEQNPQNAQALGLYAATLQQTGRPKESILFFKKSLELDPNQAQVFYNLGIVYKQLHEHSHALSCFERAISLKPTYSLAYFHKAQVLILMQKIEEAYQNFWQALELDPEFIEAHFAYAKLLFDQGKLELALEHFQKVLAHKSTWAPIHFHMGNTLHALKRLTQALEYYDQAIALDAQLADAHSNKGVALFDLNRLDEAIQSYQLAITINPRLIEAHLNLGNAYGSSNELPKALQSYDVAIALDSQYVDAYTNKGATLQEYALFDQAISCFDQALAIEPQNPKANWNKSLCALLLGDFVTGWTLYEWGWVNGMRGSQRIFEKPLWLGKDPIIDKTVFIYAEQGLGDTIQFMRYVRLLEDKGAKVILEVPPALYEIAQSNRSSRLIIKQGEPLPPHDYQCPLLSLPLALQTTLLNIPSCPSYLLADSIKVDHWKEQVSQSTRLRVGIVWSGRPEHRNDAQRSIALKDLLPLLNLPIEWHSLQKEYKDLDRALLTSLLNVKDHHDQLNDLSDTAALIQNLDLVISVDTSVAHLSAALGKPTWILIAQSPDFRWLLNRDDSPWYPSVKLFRQTDRNSWIEPMKAITQDLCLLIRS